MRLLPSDPDIETIVARIKAGDIDLQPAFQRGEVWSKAKKQRLVDSILRDWHVPPVHIIVVPSTKQEVLDGQQRLAAIRDFIDGEFALDGTIEPLSPELQKFDGKLYRDLPDEMRRRFNQFTIRVFRIVDYEPGEPGELFFRLNQPTSLTSAEQRNAFFGPVRQQIKKLVAHLEELGIDKEYIGFSNARMAYDDVLARVALAIERRSLAEKITAADLADLYRSASPLSSTSVTLIEGAITKFAAGGNRAQAIFPRFNKATVFSWLLFLVRTELRNCHFLTEDMFGEFLAFFESKRLFGELDAEDSSSFVQQFHPRALFAIYESRSSARVADVSSVLFRDAAIWIMFCEFVGKERLPHNLDLNPIVSAFRDRQLPADEDAVSRALVDNGWGLLQ